MIRVRAGCESRPPISRPRTGPATIPGRSRFAAPPARRGDDFPATRMGMVPPAFTRPCPVSRRLCGMAARAIRHMPGMSARPKTTPQHGKRHTPHISPCDMGSPVCILPISQAGFYTPVLNPFLSSFFFFLRPLSEHDMANRLGQPALGLEWMDQVPMIWLTRRI